MEATPFSSPWPFLIMLVITDLFDNIFSIWITIDATMKSVFGLLKDLDTIAKGSGTGNGTFRKHLVKVI